MSTDTTPSAPSTAKSLPLEFAGGISLTGKLDTLKAGKGKGKLVLIVDPPTADNIGLYIRAFPNLLGAINKHVIRAASLEASQPDVVVAEDNIDGATYEKLFNEAQSTARQTDPVKQAEADLAEFHKENENWALLGADDEAKQALQQRAASGDQGAVQELAAFTNYKRELIGLMRALNRARTAKAEKKAKKAKKA